MTLSQMIQDWPFLSLVEDPQTLSHLMIKLVPIKEINASPLRKDISYH